MRLKLVIAGALGLFLCQGILMAQSATDVLGAHDLGPRNATVQGSANLGCTYCHAPHGGLGVAPLWNQKLSTQTYQPYTSTTEQNHGLAKPAPSSMLCLSCHDGTVAPGQTSAYGNMQMNGTMKKDDIFGTNLQSSHPFSLVQPLQDSPNLAASLAANGTTSDQTGKVKLVSGSVECTSCHNPHVQSVDPQSPNFLAISSAQGQLCLACHDPNRTLNGTASAIADWPSSIHATAPNQISGQATFWNYGTVAQNACMSCHKPHNAAGAAQLLRAPDPALANVDAVGQSCAECHNGGTNLQTPALDVFAEYAKQGVATGTHVGTAHPWPVGVNQHAAGEPALLNGNRHATCTDCHNAHAAQEVTSFGDAPAIRVSQRDVVGISETDGQQAITAVYQYQSCLRCHGNSTNKQSTGFGYLPQRVISVASDPLNVIPQFNSAAGSKHAVFADSGTVPTDQPSLLGNMMNWDGTPGRVMGSRIFCTDCHNSDDNREILTGGGPTGPHGSKWDHLLERRYDMNQAPVPGKTITVNLAPQPSLEAGGANPGPYALCAKCHDLSTTPGKGILSDASFKPNPSTGKGGHYTHVWDVGISCSACHTAHGVPDASGVRLVDFDANLVAPYNGQPVAYNPATNTCTLMCHNYGHNADGTVTYVAP